MGDMLVALKNAGFEISRDVNIGSLKRVNPPLSKSMVLEEYGVYSGSDVSVKDVLLELEDYVNSYEEVSTKYFNYLFLINGSELKTWVNANIQKIRRYGDKNVWGIKLVLDETYRKLYVYLDRRFIRYMKENCCGSTSELVRLSKIRVGEVLRIDDSLFLLELAVRFCEFIPFVVLGVAPVYSENSKGKRVETYLGYNILSDSVMVGKLSNWLSGHKVDSRAWYYLHRRNNNWYLNRDFRKSPKRWNRV